MKKILAFIFVLFIASFSFGQSSGYGFLYNSAFSVAGTDTLTSEWFAIGDHGSVELGFAVSDSSKFEVVVYYQAGASTSQYATVTADTLTNTTDGGGFVTKILRSSSSNLIPAATYIKVRAVRIATGSATSVTFQGRVVFKD